MIVLEHTNPSTIYLDYHYWLPERGASGDMTGGEGTRYTNTGLFNSCNPTPRGEIGLGSPLTKNKSTFSDYHRNEDEPLLIAGGGFDWGSTHMGMFTYGDYVYNSTWKSVCSRLSKN